MKLMDKYSLHYLHLLVMLTEAGVSWNLTSDGLNFPNFVELGQLQLGTQCGALTSNNVVFTAIQFIRDCAEGHFQLSSCMC